MTQSEFRFTFKLAYTCSIRQYSFSSQITMREFIESATQQFAHDTLTEHPIEVVEAGHGETADALAPSEEALYTYVNGRNLAFYIRFVGLHEGCVVCNIPNAIRVQYYQCEHDNLCMECHVRCLRANTLTCPICRSI